MLEPESVEESDTKGKRCICYSITVDSFLTGRFWRWGTVAGFTLVSAVSSNFFEVTFKIFDLLPVCLFPCCVWAECQALPHRPLAEYHCSTVLNVPLLLSASLDNIWLSDLWDRAPHTFHSAFCCYFASLSFPLSLPLYFCVCVCALFVMHARSHLVRHPTQDLAFARPSLSLSPGRSVPASRTRRWNRILTLWKLPFLSTSPPDFSLHSRTRIPAFSLQPQIPECVEKSHHGRMDRNKKRAWEMWNAVQRLVR